MPCDPKPGLWAYLVCVFSALTTNPLHLAAFALLIGSAATAILLAKRRPDHRPIAWALGAVVVADLVGLALAPTLGSRGPYIGWQRLAFHADEARFLVWPLALQWAVGSSFGEMGHERQVRSKLAFALLPFYAFLLAVCVACYPGLRDRPLGYFYACTHANAVLWSVVVIAAWARRRRPVALAILLGHAENRAEKEQATVTPARVVASLLVALCALSSLAGPWWRGLFGQRYEAEQVILCALYLGIASVQALSFWREPGADASRAPSGPVPPLVRDVGPDAPADSER